VISEYGKFDHLFYNLKPDTIEGIQIFGRGDKYIKPQKSDEATLGLSYDQIDDFLEGSEVTGEVSEKLIGIYIKTQHKRLAIPTIYD
jgi:NH3-dependent NAD+ synthetase